MIEILTFFNSVGSDKWLPPLWNKLIKIRKDREKELNKINDIMFGDPLELAEYYVEPSCQEMNPADNREEDDLVAKELVMVKINQFFRQPCYHHGGNQLFILSDAGMGKSALLCMIKLMHLTSFWSKDHDCVLKKLSRKTLDELKRIENRRKTILLLDSLDEDPMAYGRVKDRLMEILAASEHFAKVIITCRTQFFPPSEDNLLKRPGRVSLGPYQCYAKYLSFFNDEKVNQYLRKRFPRRFFGLWSDKKKIEDAKNIIEKMGSLRCRPMLLSYIEDLMAIQDGEADKGEYYIYNALVESWLRRELTKIQPLWTESP